MRNLVLTGIILLLCVQVNAQLRIKESRVYKVNRNFEIPLTIGLFAYNNVTFKLLNNKPFLTPPEINALDRNDVWAFDRVAINQDPSQRDDAHKFSDNAMKITLALPFLLVLDKEMRQDWFDLLVLYGEAHAFNTGLYVIAAGNIDRIRPYVYNENISIGHKTGEGTKISFFSGHTSTTAVSSFFMAKVYSDYHPELGAKKYLLFTAALIPPAIVGAYRVKAMKHFPTDVITGTIVGAAVGILAPHFHKRKKKEGGLSFTPVSGEYHGFKLKYSFP